MRHYFAPKLIARFIVGAAEERGVSPQRLLPEAGLRAEDLEEPPVFLLLSKLTKLLAEAVRLTGDEAFALHILPRRKLEDFDILAFAAYSHPTCREVIEHSIHALNMGFNAMRDRLRDDAREANWITELEAVPPEGRQYLLELRATIKQTIVWAATGKNPEPLYVGFQHPPPLYASEYEKVFKAPIRFDHPDNTFAFPVNQLEMPCVLARPDMEQVLDQYAEIYLKQFPSGNNSLAENVGGIIVSQMNEGLPKLETVAKQMGLKPRTLQYKLREEGVSFGELLEERQRALSIIELGNGKKSITEVAMSLGFGSITTFGRAFKRWFGVSPKEYRQGLFHKKGIWPVNLRSPF